VVNVALCRRCQAVEDLLVTGRAQGRHTQDLGLTTGEDCRAVARGRMFVWHQIANLAWAASVRPLTPIEDRVADGFLDQRL
jgi:hypothetical protein